MPIDANRLNRGHTHFGLGRSETKKSVQASSCRGLLFDGSRVAADIIRDNESAPTREFQRPLEIASNVRSVRVDIDEIEWLLGGESWQ